MTDPAQPDTPEDRETMRRDFERGVYEREESQPVEATPEAWRDLVAAMVDAHEFMAPGPFSPPEDWVRMPWKRWEAIDRFARSIERQLRLAQTENAGHIRIEDELKAELRLAASALTAFNRKLTESQARCAELEKLLAEVVKDRVEATYTLGTDFVDHIDAALAKPSSR